ncbi:TIGR03621 family F420-dependent LLM class oxidoreductase [Dermatobacter hominis]|uniref:TIGR03621 family F420-dependent LLM class oxidoreductase n=1 Tax=Dermatobacter hominis TaxID=2884263 RepID=UPI001D129977|nr:TIGR03621 family F420-dependent LLM class oxidoreductase [Dermatobacter hominis]UDY35906.1 TIGR03621 family F420-dependent LLM class oxidoreductase [Dermatobacter hominis]
MAHPFRFGVQYSKPIEGTTWQETARRTEELGYSTLFVPDHFGDQLAPITALSVAAEATSTLNVGALVFDNDYRHPVTLATEMATLDLLSSGRVELGLGAGWMRTDYEQSGIAYDEPKVRVDRFEEGLAVIEGMFGDGPFDFSGEHYTITGLDGLPKPHTPGGPKLLIGGGGKRVLSIAARTADIVGVNPNLRSGEINADTALDAMASAVDRKLEWVREAAGDRFDDIELNQLSFAATLTDDTASFADFLAQLFGAPAEEVLEAPTVVAGSLPEVVDRLHARRERWGFSYYVFQADAGEVMAPLVAELAGR